MKITLQFDGDEELGPAQDALHALDYKILIQDLDNFFRGKAKYSEDKPERDRAEWARTELWKHIEDAGLEELLDT